MKWNPVFYIGYVLGFVAFFWGLELGAFGKREVCYPSLAAKEHCEELEKRKLIKKGKRLCVKKNESCL